VTYTGTGTVQNISHNLGSVPGVVIVKSTTEARGWAVYHRSLDITNGKYIRLDLTNAEATNSGIFNSTLATSTEFTIGTDTDVNRSGESYVAYLFAHNDGDGGFGESGDQDIIKCGSYTGTGSAGLEIDLGFEPQWLMIKRSDSTGAWEMMDSMRGIVSGGTDVVLRANGSGADITAYDYASLTPTGFALSNDISVNTSGGSYIYIAIRRGPMKTPESGTEVFAPLKGAGTTPGFITGWPVDALILGYSPGYSGYPIWGARLTGDQVLTSSATEAETTNEYYEWDYNNGSLNLGVGLDYVGWNLRRAPGFFDVVAYEGDDTSSKNISHNLGVVPELMILKSRDIAVNWIVYHKDIGNTKTIYLNSSNAETTASSGWWNNTTPTDTVFTIGANPNQSSWGSVVSYLFATLPGVSKVGSYTGNGTSQTIDCGFSAGARFVMTKRVNTTGNWNVWDSERGIVAGNDPRLELNTTDAEDTGHDYIDPDSSGFVVNYVADDDDDTNVSGDEYIFIAVA